MIELMYFPESGNLKKAYHLIQNRRGEAWEILEGDEMIGTMEQMLGFWNLKCRMEIPEGLCKGLVELIESQYFNRLPTEIKAHWPAKVLEVVVQSDSEYLVICRQGTDLEKFVKLFTSYVPHLLKDEWPIQFKVYDSTLSEDFELTARRFTLK